MIPRWLSAWLTRPWSPVEIEPYKQGLYIMKAEQNQLRKIAAEQYCLYLSLGQAGHRPVSTAASTLGKHGAKVRADKARAKIRAKCDEMNAALGRQPIAWP